MEVYTISFFGHRQLYDFLRVEKLLMLMLEEIWKMERYICFMVGRNGEFDELVASAIKRMGRERGQESHELVLVLPYPRSHMEEYDRYYDSIIIPEAVEKLHHKTAITKRNQWMIEQSDLIVANVERNMGGAYASVKYARRLGKRVINLAEMATDI